ncbi:MAG TPA: hypothetical protein PLV85_18430, partial [Polyangiaceae bacterium]|nr:hypothetical protein [Polyangiaceae bacterium]
QYMVISSREIQARRDYLCKCLYIKNVNWCVHIAHRPRQGRSPPARPVAARAKERDSPDG